MDKPQWKKMKQPPLIQRLVEVLTKVKEVAEEQLEATQAEIDRVKGQRGGDRGKP